MSDNTIQNVRLKRARSLVGTSEARPDGDYYPTPTSAVHALLDREAFTGSIWENSCGDGAICRVLATDLVDRGYGEAPHDFITSPYRADNVVMNPPFSMGQQFVELSLARTTGKVAMLNKLAFLEGGKRKAMFEKTPLKSVYVFSKRLSFNRDGIKTTSGASMIAFAWFVWEHGYVGKPMIEWI